MMIPCILLAYGPSDLTVRSLESFLNVPGLDIHVLENPSEGAGDEFQRTCEMHLRSGRIAYYCRFDENISNNAFQVYLAFQRNHLANSKHILVSDCDVLVPEGVLQEEIAVLDTYPGIFACGMRIDATDWSNDHILVKADMLRRMGPHTQAPGDYISSATGFWSVLFRTEELFRGLRFLEDNSRRFTDWNLKTSARLELGKLWVSTAKSIGRELNRERTDYRDRKTRAQEDFAAFRPENESSQYGVWNHSKIAPFTLYGRGVKETRSVPNALPPSVKRHRSSLETDYVVSLIRLGILSFNVGHVSRGLPKPSDPPGLWFIWIDEYPLMNGLPYVCNGKALIYLGPADENCTLSNIVRRINVGSFLSRETPGRAAQLVRILTKLLRADGRLIIRGDEKLVSELSKACSLVVKKRADGEYAMRKIVSTKDQEVA